jgi:hypothetical protein
MRRVLNLNTIHYLVPVGDFKTRITTLSGQNNFQLNKVKTIFFDQIAPRIFAKFNSQNLNGFQIICGLEKKNIPISSVVQSLKVYRIADGSWAETLIGSLTPTLAASGYYEAFADNAFLGSNELSGAETYLIEVVFVRRETTFNAKVYFNHLGCFENIRQLRSQAEFLQISKLDF